MTPGRAESQTTKLEPSATSVSVARRFVSECVEDLCDTDIAVLLTSELVANVVRHAETDVTLTVRTGPPVRVEVSDGMAATEAFREIVTGRDTPVPASALGGRGIMLVRKLATRFGLDDVPDGGKTVWFEL